VEGALAPDPLAKAQPEEREPLREIPGLRRRERTWKDEVRERVTRRRRQRGNVTSLPLFPDDEPPPEPADVGVPLSTADEAPRIELERERVAGPPAPPEVGTPPPAESKPVVDPDPMAVPASVTEPEPAPDPAAGKGLCLKSRASAELLADVAAVASRSGVREEAEPTDEEEPEDAWAFELESPEQAPRAVERPASLFERLQAAVIDLALLVGVWATVLYLTARAARVSVPELSSAWPFLLGYFVFLGLAYSAYFTGATGQTIGKIVTGLSVVDRQGRSPGVLRALWRALAAVVGVAALGAGLLPIFADPARRALHDRLAGTRVIR
jgi:uncharacterized RDD family membrane protein YckC